jgi:hypothetical protein
MYARLRRERDGIECGWKRGGETFPLGSRGWHLFVLARFVFFGALFLPLKMWLFFPPRRPLLFFPTQLSMREGSACCSRFW